MFKSFKNKVVLALPLIMISSNVPVLANSISSDTLNNLLSGKNGNVTIINMDDTGLSMEELLSLIGSGNATVVESSDSIGNLLTPQNKIETQEEVTATKSKITLPNRKLTDDELKAWIEDYEERGGANEFELEVVRLVNIERAKENLPALEIEDSLMKAARFKSQEMLDLDYFAHKSPVYNSHRVITIDFFGYVEPSNVIGVGENIGNGHSTPDMVVNSWMNSSGHRRAIMDKDYKTVGVGFVSDDTLFGNKLWTINFGR